MSGGGGVNTGRGASGGTDSARAATSTVTAPTPSAVIVTTCVPTWGKTNPSTNDFVPESAAVIAKGHGKPASSSDDEKVITPS